MSLTHAEPQTPIQPRRSRQKRSAEQWAELISRYHPGLISWARKRCAFIDLAIDLYGVMKKCEVTTMEGGYVENAGAVFYHLIGDEHFFHIAIRTRKLCILS